MAAKISQSVGVNSTLRRAIHLVKVPIIISFIVTPVRFFLELAGLPENVIFILGLLWLSIGFSVYWGFKLSTEKQAYWILLLALVIFSPISRFAVSLLWWIDTQLEIGTHYGAYFSNFQQAVLNQVGYGSLVQIIPGFLLGSITLVVLKSRRSVKK
ncbi:MAG: hypothetical protein RIG68_23150 [Imperialibacter sp.]|uniref:hypothetical protein n=1 Tax=Imperialibacter sp. TaxID=2038411 RepID=UPI0032EACBA7